MPPFTLRALAPALLLIATRAEAQWCPFTGPEFAPASIGSSVRLVPPQEHDSHEHALIYGRRR